VLGEIRRIKSTEKRPLKARIDLADVSWTADVLPLLKGVEVDVRTAAGVERFTYAEGGDRLSLSVTFAADTGEAAQARA